MSGLSRSLLPLFFAFGLPSFCQVIDAGKCDTITRFPITRYTYLLQTTKLITIDSVIKAPGFVKAKDEPVLVFNYDPYYYWFRIIVKNQRPDSRQLMLLMAPLGMYDGQLFQKIDGKWNQVAHNGLKYRFRDRSYQFTHYVFPFTLKQQTTDTLYLSIDASNAYKSFGFALLPPKDLKIFENNIYFVFGIIVGLLLLFFFLNICLFFALKERLHLWYSLYIALLFLIVMKNDHLDQQFLGLDSEWAFRHTPYMAIGALAIAVLMHVVQIFLKEAIIHNRRLYYFSIILKFNVLLSAIVHAFVFLMVSNYQIQSVVFSWAKISLLLGICIIIVNCLYSVKHGFKSALFILFGSLVFMIGAVQRLFYPSTLSFLFPPTTFHIGIIVETFVISMGLIYRYWSTEEQIQTLTINDISAEIHDNVGSKLALVLANLRRTDFNVEKGTLLVKKMDENIGNINDAFSELRNLSRILKTESAFRTDLAEQIKDYCFEVEKASGIKVEFVKTGNVFELENRKQAIILRIIKESLQNVVTHAEATKVEVRLDFETNILLIRIRDNGKGFDLAKARRASNGIKNIEKRCAVLRAKCHFETAIGRGTEISIRYFHDV